MKEISEQLKAMQYDFDPYFHTRVLAKSIKQKMGFSWKLLLPFASLAGLCFVWLIVGEGTLQLDHILGLGEYSEGLEEYIMYY